MKPDNMRMAVAAMFLVVPGVAAAGWYYEIGGQSETFAATDNLRSTRISGTKSARLPFPDATYASDPAFCRTTREDGISQHEGAYIDLKGSSISYYESECSIERVSAKGNRISFTRRCEGEGESWTEKDTWRKVGPTMFELESGELYRSCDKFIP